MTSYIRLRNAFLHFLLWGCLLHFSIHSIYGQQRTAVILNSNPTIITLESGTFINHGHVDFEQIQLKTLPPNTNGWVEFQFSNLVDDSEITVNLEDITNASNFFEFTFSSMQVTATNYLEPAKNVTLPRSGGARNDILFRLERCTNSVSWYIDNQVVYQVVTKDNAGELQTKMQVTTANNVNLATTFAEGEARCPTCSELKGSTLRAGDLMFLGFDNDMGRGTKRIVLTNLIELLPGTNFTLAEATYNNQEEKWYASGGRDDERIASFSITYTGNIPIAPNSVICFDITGALAFQMQNFMVNGIPMTDNFCVTSNGFSNLFSVDLSTSNRWSIFLMQGRWKFTDSYGLWCGTVLSGLHFGGNWTATGSIPNTAARESNLPPDIVCLPQFDATSAPSSRAFYYTAYSSLAMETKQTALGKLTTMTNFTTNSALPSDICDVAIQPLIADAETPLANSLKLDNLQVQAYPNPFSEDIWLCFQTEQATEVQLYVLDATGKILHTQSINLEIGESKQQLNLNHDLSAGLYFIQLQMVDGARGIRLVKTTIER